MPKIYSLLGDEYEITEEQAELLREQHRLDPAYQARVARAEEQQRAAELHAELIELGTQVWLKREAETAHAAKIQPHLDQVDAIWGGILKKELAAENATKRVSARQRKDFANFKTSAEKWELPYLPAAPQMIVLFLSEQADQGIKHVTRLCNSIAAVHKACNFPDVTDDPLVRGVLRCMRTEAKAANPKGTN
jgi:hypothetical protein